MPPVSFGTDLDLKLIRLVQKTPIVYDTRHEQYLQAGKRDEAWEQIGKEMGKSALACKTRWVNIRDNLRRKIRLRERKGTSRISSAFRYKYEDELTFVLPYFKGNVSEDVNVEDDGADTSDAELTSVFRNDKSFEPEYEYEVDVKPDVSALFDCDDGNASMPTSCKASVKCCGAVSTSQETRSDPIAVFLEAVGSTMRSLNPYYLNQAKSRIFQVVQDCELQQLVNKGDPPPPAPTS